MVQILEFSNVVARLSAESSRYGPLLESIGQSGMVQNIQWPGKSLNYRAKTKTMEVPSKLEALLRKFKMKIYYKSQIKYKKSSPTLPYLYTSGNQTQILEVKI